MTFQLLPINEDYSPKVNQLEILTILSLVDCKLSEFIERNSLERAESEKNRHEIKFFKNILEENSIEYLPLIEICRKSNYFFNKKIDFRVRDVVTMPDENNRCLIYPNKNFIDLQFSYLENIRANRPCCRLLKAIMVYCGIIHIHPLEDGNGRSARIIFNLLIHAYYKSEFYIDMKNFIDKNWVYFKYSLNLLQIFGVWDYILAFFVDMILSLMPKDDLLIKHMSSIKENLGFEEIFRKYNRI